MGLFIDKKRLAAPEALTAAASPPQLHHRPGSAAAKAAAWNSLRPITASAQQVNLKSSQPVQQVHASWQRDAWTAYEKVGEIHFGLNVVKNIMTRVRIHAAAVISADEAPMIAQDAAKGGHVSTKLAEAATEAMATLNEDGMGDMLGAFALNFSVPGECYIVQLPDEPGSETKKWSIRSTEEIRLTQNRVEVIRMRGMQGQVFAAEECYVGRLWKPSGRFSGEPDSSLLGIGNAVEELLVLERLVRSSARSRLNAGMLFVPDSISVSAQVPDSDEDEDQFTAGSQVFLDQLMDAMTTPISEEGNASSVVPMVVTGPPDVGEKIKHITFQRSSDEWLVNRLERTLERILQGLDIPKEIVTGLANVKYSNAIVIDENLYRANIEPLCLAFVDAITTAYLHPVLRAQGFDEPDIVRVRVWYDPSEIITRPSQAQDASDGYDKMLLSPSAWRREHGFADTDAPTEADLAFMLLVAKATLPEETTQALLMAALPKTLGKQREEAIKDNVVPFPQSAKNLLDPGESASQVQNAATGGNTQ